MISLQNHLQQSSGNKIKPYMNRSNHLQITQEIKELKTDDLGDNIYYYSYHIKHIKSLLKNNVAHDSEQFLSAYNSFIGELYENIVYERLLRYAKENKFITKFVLKGPHQNKKEYVKKGFLIDRKEQIVYKSGYKDVNEFDGLFFTNDSVYFVESTIVNLTSSLRKRLRKKKALLEILFPKLQVKALIILSQGATGLKVFPDYCTIWVTNNFDAMPYLQAMVSNKPKQKFLRIESKNFVEVDSLHPYRFNYFDTLSWILKKCRSNELVSVDLNFFRSQKVERYFDLFGKLYIGYITPKQIKNFIPSFEKTIVDKIIYTTIEKKDSGEYIIVFFAKYEDGTLDRIDIDFQTSQVQYTKKDPKGFTSSEVKYMQFVMTQKYFLSMKTLNVIQNKISSWNNN